MRFEEFKEKLTVRNGYAVLMFTDKFAVDCIKEATLENYEDYLSSNFETKLLDARFFDGEKEDRIYRFDLSEEFSFRTLKVSKDKAEGYFQKQYLDIDADRTKGNKVYTTTGGMYEIPDSLKLKQNSTVKVWSKVNYDCDGHAYVEDWCLCGFEGGMK